MWFWCGLNKMWTSNITKSLQTLKLGGISVVPPTLVHQVRSTHILKRRWPPGLYKKHQKTKVLKSKNYVYDVVESTGSRKHESIDLILSSQVSGLGNRGDKVSMKPVVAYSKLLLPGLAVYASPDNLKKYSQVGGEKPKNEFSSPYVGKLIEKLSNKVIYVMMNNTVPWTIEPWHVAMSLRVAGLHAPKDAIELPEKPIIGPNEELEGKYFNAIITINNREKVAVKCVIHHWNSEMGNRMPRMSASDLSVDQAVFPELENKVGAANEHPVP